MLTYISTEPLQTGIIFLANAHKDNLEENQESFPENDEVNSLQITVVQCRGSTWQGSGGREAVSPESPPCTRAAGRAVALRGSRPEQFMRNCSLWEGLRLERLWENSQGGSPSWSRGKVCGERNGPLGYSERGGAEAGSEAEPVRNRDVFIDLFVFLIILL